MAETDSARMSRMNAGFTERPGHLALALARSGSRALVLGTGTHALARLQDISEDESIPDIPAVAATTSAIQEALVRHCGMDASQIRSVLDPDSPHAFHETARTMARQAEDVLLVYYAGHGLANIAGEFFLATSATTNRDDMLPTEGLRFTDLRTVLATSPARHVVLILDCCLSGRASEVFGPAVADEFDLSGGQDGYLLTAASATGQALAPPGERYTAFSRAFLEFLRDGDPSAGIGLTLDDAYRYLMKVLPQRGAPAPRRRLTGNPGGLVVAANPQAPSVTRPRPDSSERSVVPVPSRPCPYPGLDAFTAQEAEHFHGRERLIGELIDALAAGEGRPLAIVGRSGAGKSSLLRAGLLPAIKDGRLDVSGSRTWPQMVMTPGEHPLTALTRRLSGKPESGGRIVCVDQFEEIFTACADDTERRAFIRELFGPSGEASAAQVIVGLRADFYSQCLEYPELAAVLEERQVLVNPMSTAELTSAIERPAAAVGLQLEAGLTGRLLHDLESAGRSGRGIDSALPMLAFTLQATWQQSDKQVLTLSDYEATGGIWGAVTQRADGVYGGLTEEGRAAARILLLSMVRLGDDGTDDTRRRVSVADLISRRPEAEHDSIRTALDAYVAARLVTVDNGTAEITHEALLRAWPRLQGWVTEDRKELLDRQRLTEAASMWKSGNGSLYAGARLAEARGWLAGKDAGDRRGLSPLERDFVRASTGAARRRRSYVATAVLAVFLLILGGVYGFQQRSGNQQSQAVRSSVQLAQEADNLRATDPAGAMWLSLSAYRSAVTAQARTALYNSLTTPYPVTLPGRGTGAVDNVAYSPDGSTAAAVWNDGTVIVWRVSDPLRPARTAVLHVRKGGISRLAFSPDSRLLAVHGLNSLRLWRTGGSSGTPVLASDTTTSDATGTKGAWLPVVFSPDGKTVATGDTGGRFRLWDVTDPAHPAPAASITDSARPLTAVAFSPDGATLAAASENDPVTGRNGQIRLWNVRAVPRPSPEAVLAVTSALDVAFSPVGHLLVSAGTDDDIHAWNVADTRQPSSVKVTDDNNDGQTQYAVAFRPGSGAFLTADSSGGSGLWTATQYEGVNNTETGRLPDSAGPDSVASGPGNGVITGDLGGSADLWTTFAPVLPDAVDTQSQHGSPWNPTGTLLISDSMNPEGGGPVQILGTADPARPRRIATLPGHWSWAYFLPDGKTIVTIAKSADGDLLRLWDVSHPRHPRAGARLPDPGFAQATFGYQEWDASGNGLLLTANGDSARLWNIRDIRHPVLESDIAARSASTVLFLGPRLVAVGEHPGAGSELRLWDITDPRHPSAAGAVPENGDSAVYLPSRHLLTQSAKNGGGPADTALWNLSDIRKPSKLVSEADMNPDSVNGLNGALWATLSADDSTISVWNTSDPRRPARLAALPLDQGSLGTVGTTGFQAGWLAVTGVQPSGEFGPTRLALADIHGNGRSIENYAQLAGDPSDIAFSPDGTHMATDIEMTGSDPTVTGLGVFYQRDLARLQMGILYPLDTDSLYSQLCKDTAAEPASSSWRQYLPATYYRPACS